MATRQHSEEEQERREREAEIWLNTVGLGLDEVLDALSFLESNRERVHWEVPNYQHNAVRLLMEDYGFLEEEAIAIHSAWMHLS